VKMRDLLTILGIILGSYVLLVVSANTDRLEAENAKLKTEISEWQKGAEEVIQARGWELGKEFRADDLKPHDLFDALESCLEGFRGVHYPRCRLTPAKIVFAGRVE